LAGTNGWAGTARRERERIRDRDRLL